MEKFQAEMKQKFMSNLRLMHYFLGVEVQQTSVGIFIFQTKYVVDLLKKFGMEACKALATRIALGEKLTKEDASPKVDATRYRSLVGSLMYLTTSRPDIMYVVSLISRFMQDPHESHWRAAKRIMRYVSGTQHFGIQYSPTEKFELVGYIDSDWASLVDDRKSTSSYVFSFGSGVVSWSSKKQATMAFSSAGVECMAASSASS
ncbi:secreted RxLR effector protein 161-like [Cryptomeria japonica]|uniref:secreted RxLR effector protein 161-like n=1 Tax=Cryptomeria japonica TaxID=3369 RepID=UPI0027DA65DC|nr:secreted RxLR effector protein 161-like [Cryptomeria japonica]